MALVGGVSRCTLYHVHCQRVHVYVMQNVHNDEILNATQQHNRKAKQHNTTRPKQPFSNKNWLPRVGLMYIHVTNGTDMHTQ